MRQSRQRPIAIRMAGWSLVIVAYLSALVWAADISAVDPAARGEGTPAAVSAMAPGNQEVAAESSALLPALDEVEQPLITLAIAGSMVLAPGAWYAVHRLRSRTRLARRARLVVRHITTLT